MASAGRILIMPKGDYDASTEYEMLDLVKHNGKSWLAKKTSVGVEPSDENSGHWHDLFDTLDVANNLTTEEEGKALDATQGRRLAEALDGYEFSTIVYERVSPDENGFLNIKEVKAEDAEVVSCRLISRDGFCIPYPNNNTDHYWSYRILTWDLQPIVGEYVDIKVIFAAKK